METQRNDSLGTNEGKQSNALRDEVLSVSRNQLREDALSRSTCQSGIGKLSKQSLAKKISTLPKFTVGEYELTLDITVDDALMEKARIELREVPEIIEESMKAFKEMIKEDPDLNMPDHDEFYVRFLRPCKWYPKSAFHLLQRYFKFSVNYPHIAKDLTPKALKKVLSSDILTPYPFRCKNGCRLFVVQGGKLWNPKEVSLDDMMRGVKLLLEAALCEPRTQINGVQVIIDMEGLSLSQVTYFSPRFASMLTEWVQKCLPCRLKNIHIVNQPFIFNMVFALFKPFLSEKLRKRIHFHGTNMQNLIATIGAENVSPKYGGTLNIAERAFGEKLWQYFCHFQEEFEELNKLGYPKKP